jgi:hypothetical protein
MTISIDRISLSSPDALLAAVPYLLGFQPLQSAVVVWLADGHIALTQRIDLPRPEDDLAPWVDALFDHAGADLADEIVVVIIAPADDRAGLVRSVRGRAAERGLTVRDLLLLSDGRWRSLLCEDPSCCPPDGRVLDPAAVAAVSAEFVGRGRAPLASRDDLEGEVRPDPDGQAATAAALAASAPPSTGGEREGREAWRDAAVTHVLEAGASTTGLAGQGAAMALHGLADIRVRDTVLWEMAQAPLEVTQSMQRMLRQLLRSAPAGHRAPVATVLAACCWLLGDGARAGIALEVAGADDPDYSLAHLIGIGLRRGLPPSVWREAMCALSREDCRHGLTASAA